VGPCSLRAQLAVLGGRPPGSAVSIGPGPRALAVYLVSAGLTHSCLRTAANLAIELHRPAPPAVNWWSSAATVRTDAVLRFTTGSPSAIFGSSYLTS